MIAGNSVFGMLLNTRRFVLTFCSYIGVRTSMFFYAVLKVDKPLIGIGNSVFLSTQEIVSHFFGLSQQTVFENNYCLWALVNITFVVLLIFLGIVNNLFWAAINDVFVIVNFIYFLLFLLVILISYLLNFICFVLIIVCDL